MYIILGIVGIIITLLIVIKLLSKLADFKATKTARQYCIENDLKYIEVKPFPNHYGLYFNYKNKNYYAKFDFEMPDKIFWKQGVPLDKIAKKGEI